MKLIVHLTELGPVLVCSPAKCCTAECWRPRNANDALCYRDYSVDDVVTTANAVERSRLQALSVACGRVRVPDAYTKILLSVTSCEQEIGPKNNSTECQQAAQLAADSGETA